MDEPETPAEGGDSGAPAAPEADTASVVLATFENSRAAEHMVASLGRDIRRQARKGSVAALIVTRHRDGSFKLVQSRVLTGAGLVHAGMTFTASTLAGFMGSMSALRGAKTLTQSAHERRSHVQQPAQRLTELLDQIGGRSAMLLMVCQDEETGQGVAARAAERGSQSFHLSRVELLAALDRLGDNYDWVRPALAQPAQSGKRHDPRRSPADS